jgi:hypothetical protein
MSPTARAFPFVVSLILHGAAASAVGQNLLVNGNFEADGIPGWALTQSVTGMPGVPVNSAQIQDFANQPAPNVGETGLWLRAFAGNNGHLIGQNARTNAFLSQTVPASAGENYTLSGWSLFEPNYSGAVVQLDPASPSGAIASPTASTFELAFLDAADSVVGAPVTLDLRTQQTGDGLWRQHTLMGLAPVGTVRARVTSAATDMLYNVDPLQSAFVDSFSLRGSSAPATELLTNGALDSPFIPGWTVVESPMDADTFELAPFANRLNAPGDFGVWLKPFATSLPEGDAVLTQIFPGVAGAPYRLSAWSAFEQFYPGGLPNSTVDTFLELAFLDVNQSLIGAPQVLDLVAAGQTNAPGPIADHPEAWRSFAIEGAAPLGTAFVRVRAGATGMVGGAENPQSAFFDDFELTIVPEPAAGTLLIAVVACAGLFCRRGAR